MQVLLWTFAIVTSIVVMTHKVSSSWTKVAWGVVGALGVACLIGIAFLDGAPPAVVNLLRATAALVSLAVVIRWTWRPAGAQDRALTLTLAFMALLSVLAFYNLGRPQFRDAAQRRATYVHLWDMRVYFPVAKYFEELQYDGIYLASVKAFADEELRGSLRGRVHKTELRDLGTYEMRKVPELAEEIHGIRDRFTEERWSEFTKDMSYFWNTMGRRGYLGSLRDHGGNATPAWLLTANFLFRNADATESTFLLTALLDPALLLLFFIVAWRTFGPRTALLCIIVYGTTTFPQFGSNWGGSTLRNDWMILLGLGVCALKTSRWMLAGVLLGWAAMIRAFPALVLFALAVPFLWWLLDRRGSWKQALGPLLKVAAGSLLCAATLFVASSAAFGFEESWGQWATKISMHADRPNINHVGLRALLQYDPHNDFGALRARGEDPDRWGPLQLETLHKRRFLYWGLLAALTLLAIVAARRLRWYEAALFGTMMFAVYLYPSNYYLHCIFLLPLLGGRGDNPPDKRWGWVSAALLALCALQYIGWAVPGHYGRFLVWSGMLLVCFIVIWLALWRLGEDRDATQEGEASAAVGL